MRVPPRRSMLDDERFRASARYANARSPAHADRTALDDEIHDEDIDAMMPIQYELGCRADLLVLIVQKPIDFKRAPGARYIVDDAQATVPI